MNSIDNNNICVSIVMPVYNAALFLPEAIEDIIIQTHGNWELICVNDGSTDSSLEILNGFSGRDDRITVISQNNRGGGAARNNGFSHAQGKYVLFLDADDRFEHDLIESALSVAEAENSDIVVYNGDKFDCDTGRVSSAPWLLFGKGKDANSDPFSITRPTIWNKMFLRSFLTENGIYHQDERVTAFSLYFTSVAMLYARRISRIDRILIHYRTDNPESSLHKHDRQPLDTLNILLAVHEKLVKDGKYDECKKVFLNFALDEICNRLGMFTSYEGYRDLYEALIEGGFDRLDLIGNDFLIENTVQCEKKNRMTSLTVAGYLFNRDEIYKELGFLRNVTYLLPGSVVRRSEENTDEPLRVFLYGAGEVGKCFYPQIQARSDMKLVGWADRDYERFGFPVMSPGVIADADYDVLLIAMEHEATALTVRKDLVSQGIPEKKIVWEHPERID